jgi:hypothetical protein
MAGEKHINFCAIIYLAIFYVQIDSTNKNNNNILLKLFIVIRLAATKCLKILINFPPQNEILHS